MANKLRWKYCECGCHGHEVGAKGLQLWLFNDLKGSFFLHEGHGFISQRLGVFSSFEEADNAAAAIAETRIEHLKMKIFTGK